MSQAQWLGGGLLPSRTPPPLLRRRDRDIVRWLAESGSGPLPAGRRGVRALRPGPGWGLQVQAVPGESVGPSANLGLPRKNLSSALSTSPGS